MSALERCEVYQRGSSLVLECALPADYVLDLVQAAELDGREWLALPCRYDPDDDDDDELRVRTTHVRVTSIDVLAPLPRLD